MKDTLPLSLVAREQAMKLGPMPDLWSDCTQAQLEWFVQYGTYGQRLIAERYLLDLKRGNSGSGKLLIMR